MNQNPEQQARDQIDQQLTACGWTIQNKSSINLHAGIGVAVREYSTDVGPADYVLFVDKKPVGIIEAKRAEEGVHLTVHEEQSQAYAESKLKYLNNDPLPFVYESTGEVTRFTDYRDPKPRSRNVFTFHRPETFREWLKEEKTMRGRLHDLPQLNTTGLRDCQTTAIMMMFRLKNSILPKYFMYYFLWPLFKSQYKGLIGGTTSPHLNIRDIKKFNVVITKIKEQERVVEEIESRLSVADKLEETITNSLQQVEALRQSILKRAFEGRLT